MASVVLRNLNKSFVGPKGEEVRAVRDLNLEVRDREFLVMVGPSGCGKTTTLRMIAGLEAVGSGTISIDGRLVNDVPPKDRDIAMVFQNYALFPHLTVFDNMAFGLRLRKFAREEIRRRVEEAAGILGLSEVLDRKPGALSGGQRQRVAVGRAIVRKPKVFLFDEPLSNLDAIMRVQMRTELARLHQRLEATMIYVTHDQAEAMTLGHRILVMNHGVAQQVDAPLRVYREPANAFVAGFMGSPPMNFFRCDVITIQGEHHFQLQGTAPEADIQPLRVPFEVSPPAEGTTRPIPSVLLGVRPENILLRTAAESPAACHGRARIEWVEILGAEAYVHATAGSHSFIVRVPASGMYQVGDPVTFQFQEGAARFFEAESGRRLESLGTGLSNC